MNAEGGIGSTRGEFAEDNVLVWNMMETMVPRTTTEGSFTFIDLFAGIGGMRLGFETIGGECVFTSEWDRFAQQTYQANFNDSHEMHGDITEIDASSVADHGVLLAGFPCQPFSIAGVSKKKALGMPHGFLDKTQGTLFYDIVRVLAFHRPRAFLLENVKHLLRHDRGNTFEVIHSCVARRARVPCQLAGAGCKRMGAAASGKSLHCRVSK